MATASRMPGPVWEQGKVFIDLGADFRLYNEQDYRDWYGLCYADPALHQKAVYALPELYRDQIKTARLLGNPGCYPTSSRSAWPRR